MKIFLVLCEVGHDMMKSATSFSAKVALIWKAMFRLLAICRWSNLKLFQSILAPQAQSILFSLGHNWVKMNEKFKHLKKKKVQAEENVENFWNQWANSHIAQLSSQITAAILVDKCRVRREKPGAFSLVSSLWQTPYEIGIIIHILYIQTLKIKVIK